MSNCIEASSFEELYKIHNREYNIGLMRIDSIEPEDMRNFLHNNFDQLNSRFKCEVDKENFEADIKQLDNLFPILDDSESKKEIIDFVKHLVSNYADVTDAPILGITVEKVTTDMCRYFHCDMNSLRLVYPLLGPGTLWVEDSNANREYLGQRKNELVVKDPAKIYQVPPKTITLLKGNGHHTAYSCGVIHASPPVSITNEPRVLLRIESLY